MQLFPLILAYIPRTLLPLSDFLPCSLPPPRSGFSNGTQEVFEPEELNAHFLSLFSVNLICVLGSNLFSCSSIRIPGYSALRSECTHSRSDSLSPDDSRASGGVVILFRQGLFFFKRSTSSLCLTPTLTM